jgi:septal ring factor EnvC (AmiA/AmiB activator)
MSAAAPRTAACFAALLAMGTVLLAASPGQAATDPAAKQQQLDKLKDRLARLQVDREQEMKRRDAVQLELRRSERAIAATRGDLADADRGITAAQGQLAELQRRQAGTKAALDAQKTALGQQMQAAFMEGRDSQLRLMLDAQDPATAGRLLAYYDYLNQARVSRIAVVHQQLDALAVLDKGIQGQLASLQALRDSRTRVLDELQQQGGERRQLLSKLDAGIRSRDAEIARLKRDQQAMQALVQDLHQALTDVPAELKEGRRFATLRGRLLWPVTGKMLNRYGETRAGGRMRWDGDLIAAPTGTPVHAVSQGRVVYADWMPHFGLLVILDHGNGYLSIYAHNQTATHQVGDWVKAGDTIAALGDSGGQDQSALYFELRHNSQTLDPRQWCRGRLPGG